MKQRRYVALLRAIAHVRMQPFREALEELWLSNIETYGMSGNLCSTRTTPTRRSWSVASPTG